MSSELPREWIDELESLVGVGWEYIKARTSSEPNGASFLPDMTLLVNSR